MNDPAFRELCKKHGTDKVTHHHYDHLYSWLLAPYRGMDRRARLLEIGIDKGNSLRVWAEYLKASVTVQPPEPELYAIDLTQEACNAAPDGVTTFCGNQCDIDFLAQVAAESGSRFDVIIDDGGHGAGQAEASFGALWPHVVQGGLYVIEDLEFSNRHRAVRWANQTGCRTTLSWLCDEITNRAFRHLVRAPDSAWVFCGEAVAIVKRGGLL